MNSSEKVYNRCIELYNKGLDSCYEEVKLDYFKACYNIAEENNFDDLIYDVKYEIASIYKSYGYSKYSAGIDYFNEERFDVARDKFQDAKSEYEKALKWSPSDDLDEEINGWISECYDCYNESVKEFGL